VRELKMPFRDAHHVTGALVAKAEGLGVDLAGLTLEEMREAEPRITDGVYGVLSVSASVRSRTCSYWISAGSARLSATGFPSRKVHSPRSQLAAST